MIENILHNLTNIGWAMLIFLCAYLSNMAFSMYYNIRILTNPFDKQKILNSVVKIMVFAFGLTLLCLAVTTLPLFANEVGWEIPSEYTDVFSNLVIIGAVLLVACKYVVEAFSGFRDILNANVKEETHDT